jgi:hypothetical protein
VFLRRSLIGPFLPETGNGEDSAGSFRGEITLPRTMRIFITSSHNLSADTLFSLETIAK